MDYQDGYKEAHDEWIKWKESENRNWICRFFGHRYVLIINEEHEKYSISTYECNRCKHKWCATTFGPFEFEVTKSKKP